MQNARTGRYAAILFVVGVSAFPAQAPAAIPYGDQQAIFAKANENVRARTFKAACQAYQDLDQGTDGLMRVDPKILTLAHEAMGGPHGAVANADKALAGKQYDRLCVDVYIAALDAAYKGKVAADNAPLLAARRLSKALGYSQRTVAGADKVPAAAAPAAVTRAANGGSGGPPAGNYTCYSGASAAFINPVGGLGTKEGTGIRFTPGQFGGYVYIMANHRYASGYSEADKGSGGSYHMSGQTLVADSGSWVSNKVIARYDPSQDVPTIFYGFQGTQGAYGCRLR